MLWWLHTDYLYNLNELFPHNHTNVLNKLKGDEIKHKIYIKAINTTENQRDIVYNELETNPFIFNECNLNIKYLKDQVTKIRKKNNYSLEDNSTYPQK